MLLLGVFAGVALVLAAVGIYGVMAYSVTQRTHEIGIRVALGASSRDVVRLIVRQGLLLVVVGVGIGLAVSFGATRLMSTMLFEVSKTDTTVFLGIPLILAATALLACIFPAKRATKVDPIVALRCE
jgi:putative ABC transport system permease protein